MIKDLRECGLLNTKVTIEVKLYFFFKLCLYNVSFYGNW